MADQFDDEPTDFASQAASGRKARTIDAAELGRRATNAMHNKSLTPDHLASQTYLSGKPAEHEKAVERILKGSAIAADAGTVAEVARQLEIEIPYGNNIKKKLASPFGGGRPKKGTGRGRGGDPETSEE